MSSAITRNRITGNFLKRLLDLRLAVLGMVAAVMAACGGGGATGGNVLPTSCSDCGTALLTFTDAAGDFLSYKVDVTSLLLKKANGTVVQTIPKTARIDFTQLVNLSEVLSAGQIPTGDYVAATLGVDFTNAEIMVDDGTGTGVQVAPVNSSGAALGYVEMTVQLDNRNHLRIMPRRVSHLAFDLDLAASNTVDLAAHKVTVNPVIVATVQPVEKRQVRARGRLASVDVAGSSYTIDVRPFHEDSQSSGQMVIKTTGSTRFEINGMVFSGADGLTQLATLTNNPVTIAFGTIDAGDGSFTAQRVLAATSAEDLRRDYLSGNVLSRSGNTLMVSGSSFGRDDGHQGDRDRFEHGPVTVTVGPDTQVTRDGQVSGTMSIADISVGQRVEVFGNLTRDSQDHASMDATAGRVRLNYTHLFGKVTAPPAGGSVTLALANIDGREPTRFNFAGTGTAPAMDADPANYEVSTGALNVSSLSTGVYTRLFGFVTPFGAAPPDFKADTLVDYTDTRASLTIGWGDSGSTDPFGATSSTALTLDLTTGLHGVISLGGPLINVATLPGLQVVPATGTELTFAIAHRRTHEVDNFSSFADFSTALTTDLNGTTPLFSLVASGNYDAVGGIFTATRLLVVLGD